MPITPNSTMGKSTFNRERVLSNSSANQLNSGMYSSGYSSSYSRRGSATGGPLINTLNSNLSENKGVSNNWYSASSTMSTMQKGSSGFEPVVKVKNNNNNSTTTTIRSISRGIRSQGREEEEEELLNMTNSPIDHPERQFRPINEPLASTTPILVHNGKITSATSAAGNSKRHNYSTSSYEYSAQSNLIN